MVRLLHAGFGILRQLQLVRGQLGGAVGLPLLADLRARLIQIGEETVAIQRAGADLVRGIDNADRVAVRHQLQLLQRYHAIVIGT
ncbi:hypothetical protein D3C72_2088610 [compost metagenome]